MKSLKETYNLLYDTSEFKSGLITWYNQLIDKSFEELDVNDVSKMFRQNILTDLAIKRAIDLFILDPYVGEFEDGGLLNYIVTYGMNHLTHINVNEVMKLLKQLKNEYLDFVWDNEACKKLYYMNLNRLEHMLKEFITD